MVCRCCSPCSYSFVSGSLVHNVGIAHERQQSACVCACVRVCVCACVRGCVGAWVWVRARTPLLPIHFTRHAGLTWGNAIRIEPVTCISCERAFTSGFLSCFLHLFCRLEPPCPLLVHFRSRCNTIHGHVKQVLWPCEFPTQSNVVRNVNINTEREPH